MVCVYLGFAWNAELILNCCQDRQFMWEIVKEADASFLAGKYGESSALLMRLCVIVWGLSGAHGFVVSLSSDVSADEHAAGSNLQHLSANTESVCLCVFALVRSPYESQWLIVVRGEQWSEPLMCATPAELTHTFSLFFCDDKCLLSDLYKSVIFLRLRHKSMPALLWIVLSPRFCRDNYPV